MEESICRLCLSWAKNKFEVINEATSQMLEVLSLKVDLNASKNPVICQDCVDIIKKSFYFKSVCIDTEEAIASFSIGEGSGVIDIKDVYRNGRGGNIILDKDIDVCRFCMERVEKGNYVPTDFLVNDTDYTDMLSTLLPEMVLDVIKDPVICTFCRGRLDRYLKFARNCSDMEEKINKYRQYRGPYKSNRIVLKNMLRFFFIDINCRVERCEMLAIEKNTFEDEDRETDNVQIKSEEAIDIKVENLRYEQPSATTMHKRSELYAPNDGNLETDKDRLVNDRKHKREVCAYETQFEEYLKSLKCEICCYETKSKEHLDVHMLVHKNGSVVNVMHKCGTCTYKTKYEGNLKDHLLLHMAEAEMQ